MPQNNETTPSPINRNTRTLGPRKDAQWAYANDATPAHYHEGPKKTPQHDHHPPPPTPHLDGWRPPHDHATTHHLSAPRPGPCHATCQTPHPPLYRDACLTAASPSASSPPTTHYWLADHGYWLVVVLGV